MADEKKFEVAGNVSIVPSGKKTVQVQQEFEKTVSNIDAGTGQTMQDMMDRYTKLLYVVDASGSMGEGMLSEETIKQYVWTPEVLAQFRAKMLADEQAEETEDEDDEEIILEESEEDDQFDEDDEPEASVKDMSDEELKFAIVMERLDRKYQIPLTPNYRYRAKGRSKMMAVKDAARDFVYKRFQRFPEARVGVFQFEDHPQMLVPAGATEQEVLVGIDRLPDHGGGGTNIYRAVEQAVNECKKRPSEIKGAHHIVLVSDGCDYGAVQVKELLPKMKEIGMVFDFIFILGATGFDQAPKEVVEVLKMVCEATGGEFVTVKTEKDFVEKFLTASNRPCLPWKG